MVSLSESSSRNTSLLPEITGAAYPCLIDFRQTIVGCPGRVSGSFSSSKCPSRLGPRHCGQSPANSWQGRARTTASNTTYLEADSVSGIEPDLLRTMFISFKPGLEEATKVYPECWA